RTCAEYFSVASLYGGGQSIRSVGITFRLMPCRMRRYWPGVTRSFTFAAFSSVMKSPGLTWASEDEAVANSAITIAVEAATDKNLPNLRINPLTSLSRLAVKH